MDKSVELAELELKLAKVERELKDLHPMIKHHAERYSIWVRRRSSQKRLTDSHGSATSSGVKSSRVRTSARAR